MERDWSRPSPWTLSMWLKSDSPPTVLAGHVCHSAGPPPPLFPLQWGRYVLNQPQPCVAGTGQPRWAYSEFGQSIPMRSRFRLVLKHCQIPCIPNPSGAADRTHLFQNDPLTRVAGGREEGTLPAKDHKSSFGVGWWSGEGRPHSFPSVQGVVFKKISPQYSGTR